MNTTQTQISIDPDISTLAVEQVIFLKTRYEMTPADIIQLYGGQTLGDETYDDAVERIAVFNWLSAEKRGFIAS